MNVVVLLGALFWMPAFSAGPEGPGAINPDEPASIIRAEITPAFFCIDCFSCVGGHVTQTEGVEEPTYGGGSHDDACLSGDCLQVHGVCGGDEQPDFDPEVALSQAVGLQNALLEGDVSGLITLLGAEHSVIRYEAPRRSFQILNCAGDPVANFPVRYPEFFVAIGNMSSGIPFESN